jgi:hypothetical protein
MEPSGEAALKSSEVRYRRLFEPAKDGTLIPDVNAEAIHLTSPPGRDTITTNRAKLTLFFSFSGTLQSI